MEMWVWWVWEDVKGDEREIVDDKYEEWRDEGGFKCCKNANHNSRCPIVNMIK